MKFVDTADFKIQNRCTLSGAFFLFKGE